MKKNVFSRRLTVFTESMVNFLECRKILEEKFPDALVAPLLRDYSIRSYIIPQRIKEAPLIMNSNPWCLVFEDICLQFSFSRVDIICNTFCSEDKEINLVCKMYSLLKDLFDFLEIDSVRLVAYAPKIGIEEANLKASDYLILKMLVQKNGQQLSSIRFDYTISRNILGEERQTNCEFHIARGRKQNINTNESFDCLIVEIDYSFKSDKPIMMNFVEEFFAHTHEWNDDMLNMILQ